MNNTRDTDFDRVWAATLGQVRTTRRRRRFRRAAVAALAGTAVVLLTWRLVPPPPAQSAAPAVVVAAEIPPPTARIAVYRLDAAGNLRMEEVGAGDIPPLEMVAALSPVVIADPVEGDFAHWP